METIILTTQVVCYGVGIVSASLNIAGFVRRRRRFRLRRAATNPCAAEQA
jgi:hypothetical protein